MSTIVAVVTALGSGAIMLLLFVGYLYGKKAQKLVTERENAEIMARATTKYQKERTAILSRLGKRRSDNVGLMRSWLKGKTTQSGKPMP